MKKVPYLFIGLSLVVWLVEMFTGWFDQDYSSVVHGGDL